MDGATSTRKVYLFGQLVAENQWPYGPQPGFHITLGGMGTQWFYANYFKGLLDELKVWDHILPVSEIRQNVHSFLTGNEIGLLAYYKFDEGCTEEVFDSSPAQHAGVLYGGAGRTMSDIIRRPGSIFPGRIGNNGLVTLHLVADLAQNDSVSMSMSKPGSLTLVSDTAFLSGTNELIARFQLTSADTGLYNCEVTLQDGQILQYPDAVLIEPVDTAGGVEIGFVGRNIIRDGGTHSFFITYENTSNVDVSAPGFVLHSYDGEYIGTSTSDWLYEWQRLPLLLGDQIRTPGDEIVLYDTILSPGIPYEIPITVDMQGDIYYQSNTGNRDDCSELSQYVLTNTYPNRIDQHQGNGHNYIDGCSSPASADDILNWALGTNIDWQLLFEPACYNHDLCYQTCYQQPRWARAREICDQQMWHRMQLICAQEAAGNSSFPVAKCLDAAQWYYIGLRAAGEAAFFLNQQFCTGNADLPPPDGTGDDYEAPDCTSCPPASICFRPRHIGAFDPNAKVADWRYGNATSPLNYTVYFESVDSATAAAQRVLVIDTLDLDRLDVGSFSFSSWGWGPVSRTITMPEHNEFSSDVDLRPDQDLIVRVHGIVDDTVGVVKWTFTSLDPATMELTMDPLLGFLPPNDSTGQGQGFVSFEINALPDMLDGDSVQNCATIYFDYNEPVQTNCWSNTIDGSDPNSSVLPLAPVQYSDTFLVTWSGIDGISGVAYFTVYVSINSGPFEIWLDLISDTSATFHGGYDSTFAFYSIAVDSAGNIEAAPPNYDAFTECLDLSTSVVNVNSLESGIAVIPNPNDGSFTLQLYSSLAARSTIVVTDMLGQLVFTGPLSLQRGVNSHRMELPGLGAGMYSIRVSDQVLDRIVRFVKE